MFYHVQVADEASGERCQRLRECGRRIIDQDGKGAAQAAQSRQSVIRAICVLCVTHGEHRSCSLRFPHRRLSNSSIKRPKAGRSSDCAPSESAFGTRMNSSIISPSAPPHATAASTSARSNCAAQCRATDSAQAKCDNSLTSATAARSSVLRVAVSNVLMPRSHRTTFALPPESRYSAASNHSFTVADGPRFNSIGFATGESFRAAKNSACCARRPEACRHTPLRPRRQSRS